MALSPISSATNALNSIQTNTAVQQSNLQSLSTGRSVNSITDNPQAFVLAQGLLDRAGSLGQVGSQIGQGIGALQAANDGLSAIGKVVDQLKAVAQQAQATTDTTQLNTLQGQYNTLVGQIDSLAADSSYSGVNLIGANPGSLAVPGGSSSGGTTTISGQASDSSALGITPASNWASSPSNIASDLSKLDQATQTVQSQAADLGSNVTVLQNQASFVQSLSTTASQGASKLTSTDVYQAASNALQANSYRQLGYAALRNSTQSQDAILGLFTGR